MKKFLKIFLGILFLALLVGTFVFLWNKTRPVKVVYTLATPVHDTIRQYVIASGKVEPRDEVLIKPQISGIISEVLCKAGDRVKQGDVIATVKVIPEMGTLNAAESRVTVARLSLDQTRKEFERTEALYAKRGIAGGVREGADHPAPGRRGVPECRRQPGNRQNRYYQPIQRFKQHPDTLHHHGYDPRRTDQGRQLGDPGQHLQRRHHDRHGRRHGRHALPGQCR